MSQYEEDVILMQRFGDKPNGFVVDVGASDGMTGSNTFYLTWDGWGGVLIEPEKTQFELLQRLYADRPDVVCLNEAIGIASKVVPFYVNGPYSTLSFAWQQACIKEYDICYQEVIETVRLRRLGVLLRVAKAPKHIDFLSVDCEGWDLEVLQSMDWEHFDVDLICVEGVDCGKFLHSLGYSLWASTRGNLFYAKD